MRNRIARLFTAVPAPKHAPRARLSVEPLEERAVPANYTAGNVAQLIAAMDASNATPEPDTITLVAGKTFTLTAANNTTDGPNGLPVVAAGGGGLTIVGNNDIIERAKGNSIPAFRLFDVVAGGELTLIDLTIRRGHSSGYGASGQGGAIRSLGTLTLTGVKVSNNIAKGSDGAAPWAPISGQPGLGGGIYSAGTLVVVDSDIRGNEATGGKGYKGGTAGVFDMGPYIWPGGAGGDGLGGGIYIAAGSAEIINTTLTGNSTLGGDGGKGGPSRRYWMSNHGGDGGDGLGGGLYAAAGSVSLTGVTITMNVSTGGVGGPGTNGEPNGADGIGRGGGIYLAPGTVVSIDPFSLVHIKDNHASTADDNISGH